MRSGALPRLCLVVAVAVAPLACASAPERVGGVEEPGRSGPRRTREQVLNRDRALIAGLATGLALGLVGLGTLLANANLATPGDTAAPHEMPTTIAVAGGLMSLGFIAAIPLGVAVDRHRGRHPEIFRPGPRPTASLSPHVLLRPARHTP